MNWPDFIEVIWQFALVAGVSFVVLSLLASMIHFYQLQHPALLLPASEVSDAMRFTTQIAGRLGTAYRLPEPFCVFCVSGPALADADGARRESFLAALKAVIRRQDVLLPLDANTAGILMDQQRRFAESVVVRLQEATREMGGVRVGAASCPENGARAQVLLDAARAALPAEGVGWLLAEPTAPGAPAAGGGAEPPFQDSWLDPLTGVLKPDRLSRVAPKFIARYRREGAAVSMILFDVDYLGRYNDHYGREAGDAILRGVGKLLQECLREDDLIGRTGGDGFVVLLSCTPALAFHVAGRLTSQIKRANFSSGEFSLKVTVSGGVAGYPDHGRTAEVIHDAAHAALLAAQERGRNQCLLSDASMRTYQTLNRGPDKF